MNPFKKLMIPLIIVGLLLVVVVVWLIIDSGKDKSNEAVSLDVVYVATNDVADFKVEKKNGETMEFTSEIDDINNPVWTMVGASAGKTYSQDAITSYVSLLTNFSANSYVGDDQPLSEYGLDDPEYVITITKRDGSVEKVLIGDQTYDKSYCYFKTEDSPKVYTVAIIKRSTCANTELDFLTTKLLDIDYNNLEKVAFSRTTDGVDILASCNVEDTGDPSYTVTSPYSIKASPYFKNMIEYIATLEIASFIELTPADLDSYGLTEPVYNFVFTMKTGEVIDVHLSYNIDGYYYGYSNVVDGYFSISSMQIKGLDTSELDLIDNYVCYKSVSDVSNIIGRYNGEEFKFSLDVPNAISDADSVVKLDGREAKVITSEGRSYSAMLYEAVACIDIGGIERDAAPALDPVLTLVITTKDSVTQTYDFVSRNENSYYVFIDGEYSYFYVYKDELFRDGKGDTYSYGVWPAYQVFDEAIGGSIAGVYDIPVEQ